MVSMRSTALLFIHLITTLLKLLRLGGVHTVIAETLLVKQQLIIMKRSQQRAPKLSSFDRVIFGLISFGINPARFAKVAVIISPTTLLLFHQAFVNKKHQQMFSSRQHSKPGPKGPSKELIQTIVQLKARDPSYVCPRIAQLITSAFGIEINNDVVRRALANHYMPASSGSGPSWLTLIGQTKDSLWSVDLFRCEPILMKTHWIMVIMEQYSRRIFGFAVHTGTVDGSAVCRMFNQIKHGQPNCLSTDNDPLFLYKQWQANLRTYEIEKIKSIPSHPFIEHLIGSVRREYLDHTLFWNRHDLQQNLDAFKERYNDYRAHAGLGGKIPRKKIDNTKLGTVKINNCTWKSHCRGLFQTSITV